MLFVKYNALWFDAHVGEASPQKVAQLFLGERLPPYPGLFYYGHIQWDGLFAWSQV